MKADHWIKVLSVSLALMLWGYVFTQSQSEARLEVPVHFLGLGDGLKVVGARQKTVTLTIRGHDRLVSSLHSAEVAVALNLFGFEKGRHKYIIRPQDARLPSMLRVLKVEPEVLNFVVDKTVTREVPVRAVIIGTPEAGYRTGEVTVTPETVTVVGTPVDLKKIDVVPTEHVDVTYAFEDVVEDVGLDLTGLGVSAEQSSVKVRVSIKKER